MQPSVTLAASGLVVFMSLYAGTTQAAGDRLTLVDNGRPTASIVIAASPTRVSQLAAYELRFHIEKMSGARLPIVHDPAAGRGVRIFVGQSKATRQRGIRAGDLQRQQYRIRFDDDALILMGRDAPAKGEVKYGPQFPNAWQTWPQMQDAQGTMHAVYEFLEDHLDVRWWSPTELGLDIPRRRTITVEGDDRVDAPAFSFRSLGAGDVISERQAAAQCYWHRGSPPYLAFEKAAYPELTERYAASRGAINRALRTFNRLWLYRMRLGGGERYHVNHSITSFFTRFWERSEKPQLAKHFVEHRPEWFAHGYEGTPNQLCYTEPAVVDQFVEDARAFFDGRMPEELRSMYRSPAGSEYFSLVPADGWGFCRCNDCEALKNEDEANSPFFNHGYLSNYWFGLVKKVARELKKSHPDKFVATLAYSGYAEPPDFKLPDNVAVQLCLHARHAYDTVAMAHRYRMLSDWREALPAGRRLLWLYYTFPRERAGDSSRWHVFPGFFMQQIAENFRRYHREGYRGAFFNGWAGNINAYLTLQMLQDPQQDVEQILQAYFDRYYGQAAGPMQKLFEKIEHIYSDRGNYPVRASSGLVGHQTADFAWAHLGTAQRMAEMRALLDQARQLAKRPITRQRIDVFDRAIWSYMEAGREKYVNNLKQRRWRKHARAYWLRGEPAAGQLTDVNWHDARAMTLWSRPFGEPTLHTCSGRIAHDGQYLYVRYTEYAHPTTAHTRQPGQPQSARLHVVLAPGASSRVYRVSIDPTGRVVSNSWVDGKQTPDQAEHWPVHVHARHDLQPGQRWRFELAIPLAKIGAAIGDAPDAPNLAYVAPGDQIGINVVRTGGPDGDIAMWSPANGAIFAPENFARLTLDASAQRPDNIPDDQALAKLTREDLRGWWPFEKLTDGRTADSSGNGNAGRIDATEPGRVRQVDALVGKGLAIAPGPGAVVVVPDDDSLDVREAMTWSMWLKRDPRRDDHYLLAAKGGEKQQPTTFSLAMRQSYGAKLAFALVNEAGESQQVNTQFYPKNAPAVAPAWSHVVATWDGQYLRLYLNGRLVDEPKPLLGPLVDSPGPLTIGGDQRHGRYAGVIDEAALYGRAMSEGEVLARYRQGLRQRDTHH